MICWSWLDVTARVFSFLRELVLVGAAVAGAVIAAMGLSTWRKQLRWQARHDAAFKTLRATIELHNTLRDVRRNRFLRVDIHELVGPNNDELLQKIYEQHRLRLDLVLAARDRLQAAELDAATLFGDEQVHQALAGLYDSVARFAVAFEEYYERQRLDASSLEVQLDLLNTIYEPRKDDVFGKHLDDSFSRAREFLSPHMR